MTERDLVESDGSVERLLNEVVDSLQAGESDAARTSMEDLANALHSCMAGSGSVANRQRYAETLENIEYCLEELGATNLKDAIACAERAAERWALRS